jgi:alpha-ribazole phosphatase
MSEFLFIRHAETDMAGRFCGHADPPVNARGEEQIRSLIQSLRTASIDAVYCSDLQRAVTTAQAIADAFASPLTASRELREINFGEWEGLSWAEIEQRDVALARKWVDDFPNLSAPGGEAFADFQARILGEIKRIHILAKERRVAVVTHGGVMRVVLCALLGYGQKEAWELTKPYCSLFTCQIGSDLQEARQ